jgi:hypothetical protein
MTINPANPPAPEPSMTDAEIVRCLRGQATMHYAQAEFGLTFAHPELLNQAACAIDRLTTELQTMETKLCRLRY